jgi:hypothetical protein
VALAAALLGYRQWKRSAKAGSLVADRQAAYKSLNDSLNDLELYVRTNPFDRAQFDQRLRHVNELVLRHAPFVDEPDLQAAREYASALERFALMLKRAPADIAGRRAFATTGEIAPWPKELQGAYDDLAAARAAFIAAVRAALGSSDL